MQRLNAYLFFDGTCADAMLAEGGQVTVLMDKSFWAEAFGMLVDKFGTPWLINGAMTRT